MAYLRSGIDGGRPSSSLVRNRVVDIRGDLATGGKLLLTTTEPTVVDGNELGRIDFQAPLDTGGTDAILVAASIYAEADDTFASDNNATELVFATGASETAAEKMRITSDGKVGIGTATPVTDLTVEGPITIKEQAAADADTAGYGQIWVDDAANSPLMYTNDAGDDIGITTGATMNAASLGGVLPSGVTGGSGLTALGTVGTGNIGAVVVMAGFKVVTAFRLAAGDTNADVTLESSSKYIMLSTAFHTSDNVHFYPIVSQFTTNSSGVVSIGTEVNAFAGDTVWNITANGTNTLNVDVNHGTYGTTHHIFRVGG
jgi:hypothetical protein